MTENFPLISQNNLVNMSDDGYQRLLISHEEIEPVLYTSKKNMGAVYWKTLLWDIQNNRKPADSQHLINGLTSLGYNPNKPIVFFSKKLQFATYAYWAAKVTGAIQAFVLDFEASESVQQLNQKVSRKQTLRNTGWPHSVDRDYVQQIVNEHRDVILLDLRSPIEFNGDQATPDPTSPSEVTRTGRIPGSTSLPNTELLNARGGLLSLSELEERISMVVGSKSSEVVTYCRSGHRGSLGWFVMSELLGYSRVSVYNGSWLEWANLVGAPKAT